MSYEIILFGTTPVSSYIQPGDQQNIGTGRALSSFLQLPGGGWYNNYRGKKAPQGIRPPTKSGIAYGTNQEILDYIDSWRALLGEFNKLTVQWFTGELRWQWAELTDVDTPTLSKMKGGWAPYTLTWITAAQNWRQVVYGTTSWAWGDGSWVWSDGTAEFGTDAQTFPLSSANQTITVNHGGAINASNVTLRFTITGAWLTLHITNETTGQQIDIDRTEYNSKPLLEINAGAHSIYAGGPLMPINTIYRNQNRINATLWVDSNLSSGGTMRIEGTDEYDGDYYPLTASGSANVLADIAADNPGFGVVNGGTVRGLYDLYNQTVFSDRNRWLVLAPGDNTLRFEWTPFPPAASVTVEFVDHFG